MKKPLTVLFICTGNICRSAMAEAIAKKLQGDRSGGGLCEFISAGTGALIGNPPNEKTIRICRERNIDISTHKGQQLSEDLLKKADLALCMATDHKEIIANNYPELMEKIFLLKEFEQSDVPKNLSIDDPMGKSIEVYATTFETIWKEILRILPALQKRASEKDDCAEG